MAKLTTAQMKKAVEEFKKKFTTGFYHGSPSPNIKKFDPSKARKDELLTTPGITFATPDPKFAHSFTPIKPTNDLKVPDQYTTGATVYPINVNFGKHLDPDTEEGELFIRQFVKGRPKTEKWDVEAFFDPNHNYTSMESPDFVDAVKAAGYDTFAVNEGGVKNVGVFKPQNIRGKFAEYNPEEAANPDFMKAEGGAVEGYAPGGKVVKKFLEHARQVPFVHYSGAPNISTLDPNRYGTGIKGAESGRLKNAPDIRPRSYIYTKAGGRQPEQGLGPHKYEGVADDLYPLHDDPAGFSAMAKQKAIDPYMMQFGREVVDEATHLNELERLIKKAGYKGYANDDVGLLFDPTPVIKAE